MRILIIVDDFLPHSTKIAAKMIHDMALTFNNLGHYTTILTPAPNQKESLLSKEIEGVKTLFFKSGKIKNVSKLKRAVNETLLSHLAWKATKSYFKNNSFDGIVYYSPSIFFGSLVKKLKKLWHCNAYLILRDVFPQWAVDNQLISKNSPIYLYFKYFERINYQAADSIGVMSPSNLEFFRENKRDASKFEVLYNWAELPHIPAKSNKFRKNLNLENKIVFFYGGNIGHAQKMSYFIDLAKQIKYNPMIHFLFVGNGDEVNLVLTQKEKQNLTNLTYLPSVDQKTYYEMLNEFDIGLFSLHPDHKTHNFPGKLLGYMAYKKPILGCVNKGNDLKQIINDAKAGIVVDSGNEDALYEAAINLYSSVEMRKNMGQNGRILLKNQFSVESACAQIISNL